MSFDLFTATRYPTPNDERIVHLPFAVSVASFNDLVYLPPALVNRPSDDEFLIIPAASTQGTDHYSFPKKTQIANPNRAETQTIWTILIIASSLIKDSSYDSDDGENTKNPQDAFASRRLPWVLLPR
jgi:hypothetical protein